MIIEKALLDSIPRMGVYGCLEVTIGFGTGRDIVDFITYDTEDIFRCYEIKVSRADFHSKAAWSFHGDYNYFVMPEALFPQVKEYIPKGVGVYVFDGYFLHSVKKASRNKNEVPRDTLKNSMIRSLFREARRTENEADLQT